MPTTKQVTITPAPNTPAVCYVTDESGTVLGRIKRCTSISSVTRELIHTYRATRSSGTDDDARRVSQGFRSIDSAAAWIAKAAR